MTVWRPCSLKCRDPFVTCSVSSKATIVSQYSSAAGQLICLLVPAEFFVLRGISVILKLKKKRSLFLPHIFASKWRQVLSTWQDTLDLPTYQSHATHCTYKIKCLLLFTVSWQWAIHSGLYISGSDEVCLQLHKLYTRYQRLFGMYCIQFI